MNLLDLSINIEYVLTPQAQKALEKEGIKELTLNLSMATGIGLPTIGDSVAWEWIADGMNFTVLARRFFWKDAGHPVVNVLLGLTTDQP
jgi:hypothetical protein